MTEHQPHSPTLQRALGSADCDGSKTCPATEHVLGCYASSPEPVAKPHRLVAVLDRWGEPQYRIECPYTMADRKVRRCNLIAEPDKPCLWLAWEDGEHHIDCPAWKVRDAECVPVRGPVDHIEGLQCWPEVPEECEGLSSEDFGHGHPVEGCYAIQMIEEVGWDEGVGWHPDREMPAEATPLPLDIDVWSNEDGVEIALWGSKDVSRCPNCGQHEAGKRVPPRFRSRGPFCNDPFHDGEDAR